MSDELTKSMYKIEKQIDELTNVPHDESIDMLELRASKIRMLFTAMSKDDANLYLVESRVNEGIDKLRRIARRRIAREIRWKPKA